MAKRCDNCDLPIATNHDETVTPEGGGAHLCWRRWNSGEVCAGVATDWRARAMTAEGALAAMVVTRERMSKVVREAIDASRHLPRGKVERAIATHIANVISARASKEKP